MQNYYIIKYKNRSVEDYIVVQSITEISEIFKKIIDECIKSDEALKAFEDFETSEIKIQLIETNEDEEIKNLQHYLLTLKDYCYDLFLRIRTDERNFYCFEI